MQRSNLVWFGLGAAGLLLAMTPGAAAEDTPLDYCTTTDYDFEDPRAKTGPYKTQSGSPVPNWIFLAVVVHEWTPAGTVWFTVRVTVDVNSCIPP